MSPTRPGEIEFAIVPNNIERETRTPVYEGAIERSEVKKPGIPEDTKIPEKNCPDDYRKVFNKQ